MARSNQLLFSPQTKKDDDTNIDAYTGIQSVTRHKTDTPILLIDKADDSISKITIPSLILQN